MGPLLTLIARQSQLKLLRMTFNSLTAAQESKIRSAVTDPACKITFAAMTRQLTMERATSVQAATSAPLTEMQMLERATSVP